MQHDFVTRIFPSGLNFDPGLGINKGESEERIRSSSQRNFGLERFNFECFPARRGLNFLIDLKTIVPWPGQQLARQRSK
jgi:hypothetical protein